MNGKLDLGGLAAGEPQERERAALALYDAPDRDARMSDPRVAAALRQSVAAGNWSAAALFLLGRDASPDSVEALREARRKGQGILTKLRPWLAAAPVEVAVDVALSRQGETEARSRLLRLVEDADATTLGFLLDSLPEIDSPEVLHALARRTLGSETGVMGGVPSGAEPARRLGDQAVDAFSARLELPVSFERQPYKRYSPDEVEEVRRLLRSRIPQ